MNTIPCDKCWEYVDELRQESLPLRTFDSNRRNMYLQYFAISTTLGVNTRYYGGRGAPCSILGDQERLLEKMMAILRF